MFDAFPSADLISGYVLGAMLLMLRVLGAVWWAPSLGENQAPMQLRVGFALVVALVLDLGLGGLFIALPTTPLTLALLVGRELLLGLALGFAISLVLTAVESAGSLAALSMGLSFNVFVDPTSGNESLALGGLLRSPLFSCATLRPWAAPAQLSLPRQEALQVGLTAGVICATSRWASSQLTNWIAGSSCVIATMMAALRPPGPSISVLNRLPFPTARPTTIWHTSAA